MKRIFGYLLIAAGLVLALGAQAADSSRVWVVFKAGQKAPVQAQIQAAQGRIHYEFDDLRAIAVTLPSAALSGMRANPGVELVEEDPPRYPYGQTIPYGIDKVQARDVWGTATGAGIKVGVIDSGVYVAHEDLSGVAISGYDGPESAGDWSSDGCAHGTHVVGTIAAANNALGVVGVSPGAVSVYMVKVFGDDCGWAYSSTLVHAAQRAKNAGARVISMSLGGSVKSTTENRAFNDLYNAGILSIAAAGNSGTSQNSYPASYSSVVSVAAVDQNGVVADFSQKNSQVELAAPGVGVLSTVSYVTPKVSVGANDFLAGQIDLSATGTVGAILVDGGKALTSNNLSWQGKVVLVERGDISFYDKVKNVQDSGGVAAVIYNNVPGGYSGTLGSGNSSTIPAVSITQEDGETLKGQIGNVATVASPPAGAVGSGYAYYDGTSMATPHVSAVAALVWSCHPSRTNVEIRSALQQSAKDLGPGGKDNSYGYGLVQAKAALDLLGACTADGGGGGGSGDTTPPVITNVSSAITNAKNGSFEITWTTNEPSTSDVSIAGSWYTDSNLTTSHKRNFRGQKGVRYEYSVRSVDAVGNSALDGPYFHQN